LPNAVADAPAQVDPPVWEAGQGEVACLARQNIRELADDRHAQLVVVVERLFDDLLGGDGVGGGR